MGNICAIQITQLVQNHLKLLNGNVQKPPGNHLTSLSHATIWLVEPKNQSQLKHHVVNNLSFLIRKRFNLEPLKNQPEVTSEITLTVKIKSEKEKFNTWNIFI